LDTKYIIITIKNIIFIMGTYLGYEGTRDKHEQSIRGLVSTTLEG
jgi:hypothetical protein